MSASTLQPPPVNTHPVDKKDLETSYFTKNWQRFFLQLWKSVNTLGGTSGGAANPSATVGPAATNGTAFTFMRSDAAPAINLTAQYTWTGRHSFGAAVNLKSVVVTYSTSITPNASLGSVFIITATNGTAFTINAPTNPTTDQTLKILIRNTSGGALGAITWDAVFKMSAWTSPATGNSRAIEFYYNGTNWVQLFQAAADVPN